jgi:hypothetical protein
MLFEFEAVERRSVAAGFDGGNITSHAGALLLGRVDRGLCGSSTRCITSFAAVDAVTARHDRLEAHIAAALPDWSLAVVVHALQALRGMVWMAAATLGCRTRRHHALVSRIGLARASCLLAVRVAARRACPSLVSSPGSVTAP